MRRFLDFPVQAHLERALHVQRCPTIASVPSSGPYATQSETPKESVAPCPRELTGENSPHLYRGVFSAKSLQVFSTLVDWVFLWLGRSARFPSGAFGLQSSEEAAEDPITRRTEADVGEYGI